MRIRSIEDRSICCSLTLIVGYLCAVSVTEASDCPLWVSLDFQPTTKALTSQLGPKITTCGDHVIYI